MVVRVLQQFSLALKWAHSGPNWALKWVFANYFNFGSFDTFNIAYSVYYEWFMFMFMPAKADPATSSLAAMPLSTSQRDARQWATFPPSGREQYPISLSTPDAQDLFTRCSLGWRVYWLLGLSSAGTGHSRPCVPGFWPILNILLHYIKPTLS